MLLLTIFIVYKYISRSSSSKSTTQQPSIHNPLDSNPPNDINEQVQLSENSSSTNVTPEMSISSKNNKEIVFSLLRVLGITIVLVAIIAVAIYLYLKLDLSSIPETPVSIPILSSFLIGHSASILFLLFSVTMLALVLIELARFLFNRIVLFKNAHSANTDNKNSLTHLLSILIVFSLIYYSFDFSNFTMDSFTELVSSGDYLAIPLVIIVGIVAVVLLIRLTHIILWLILKSEPVDIEKFVKENQAYIDLKKYFKKITQSIVDIILGTIESTLTFVLFIPNFFDALSAMVIYDETEDCEDRDNVDNNGDENNSTATIVENEGDD